MDKAMIALINALVEDRAHILRMREAMGQMVLGGPVIDIAKAELREEFKAYPEVLF